MFEHITVLPELLDEDGQPTGYPDSDGYIAVVSGGSYVSDEGRVFLCRVRCETLPDGAYLTEEDYAAANPDEWEAFGMLPKEYYDEEIEETFTFTPSIPVFL